MELSCIITHSAASRYLEKKDQGKQVSLVVTSLRDSNSANRLVGRLSTTELSTTESYTNLENIKFNERMAHPTSSPMWNVLYPERMCEVNVH
jgi:predicted transcriptional regulator